MGILDDAIREHLELKRRSGAAEEEVAALEQTAFGPGQVPAPAANEPSAPGVGEDQVEVVAAEAEAEPAIEAEPEPEPEPAAMQTPAPPAPAPADEYWLDEPDEVPAQESLDHRSQPTQGFAAADAESEFVSPDEEPAENDGEDVLEGTPDFLQETPEHDRLWFEQKPPKDFDFGG